VEALFRCLGHFVLLALGVALFPSGISAYQNSTSNTADEGSVSLKGTVVDSATGEPIHKALVQAGGAISRAMLTGPDGKFDFEGMRPGPVVVNIRKPGYFNEYELSEANHRPDSFDLQPSTPPIVLKLIPEGVIYGRITQENGEPLENISVNLTHMHNINGHLVKEPQGNAVTDEDGAFRLAELTPGTYFISVSSNQNGLFMNIGPPASVIKQGLPLTFYPGVPDLDSAGPIIVQPGTRFDASFSPPARPLYQLAGTISGFSRGGQVEILFVSATGEQFPLQVQFDPQTGIFQAPSVPAGQYIIVAICQCDNGKTFVGTTPVNLNSNLVGLHVSIEQLLSIDVDYSFELSNRAQESSRHPANIQLVSTNLPMTETENSSNNRHGGDAIPDVFPGTYQAIVRPEGPWYVASATYGSSDLFRDPIVIAPGTAPERIQVTLRDDGATLNGTVMNGDQPVAGAVLLISDSSPTQPRVIETNARGNFQASMLAPGTYNAIAFDRLEDLEYANPQALLPFATREKELTLAANGAATIQLELVSRGH
jgi:hypothetical protein